MPRSTGNPAGRARRKRLLKAAKGYRGARSKRYRSAHETVLRAMAFATRDRRVRKREFRRLWTVRINAAARELGLSYSRFIYGLGKAGVAVNRKVLADIALSDPPAFAKLVEIARGQG
ncbi:MAG: 50S ribosomal protein L20 [bacterium]